MDLVLAPVSQIDQSDQQSSILMRKFTRNQEGIEKGRYWETILHGSLCFYTSQDSSYSGLSFQRCLNSKQFGRQKWHLPLWQRKVLFALQDNKANVKGKSWTDLLAGPSWGWEFPKLNIPQLWHKPLYPASNWDTFTFPYGTGKLKDGYNHKVYAVCYVMHNNALWFWPRNFMSSASLYETVEGQLIIL